MAQLQHWTVTCTTCDQPAVYHCNTCGDILCPRCREIHQRSRGTGHHSIVPYSERVEPGKLTGQCDDHQSQPCMLWCQRCDQAACTLCVTSDDHEGHKFIQMTAKLEGQRKAIRDEFDEYTKLLKQWEDSVQNVQSSMKAYENDVEELGKEITRSADRVCDQVRSIEAELQKQLQDMKNTQTSILQDQENTLHQGIAGIKQQIKEAEDKLRAEDVGVLLHYKAKNNKGEISKPPVNVCPTPPAFTSGKLNIQSLESMIGSLSIMKEEYGKKKAEDLEEHQPSFLSVGAGNTAYKEELPQTTSSTARTTFGSLSIVKEEYGRKKAKDIEVHQPFPLPAGASKEELPDTTSATFRMFFGKMVLPARVISTVQIVDDCLPFLACTGSGQAFVKTGDKRLQLMDRAGNVKQTIKTEFYIRGITVAPQGNLLISDYDNKSIKSVSANGNIETFFETKWLPYGICCLHNGDVVVAFFDDSRVIQYRRNGKVVREFGKSLFTKPLNVAQNKINNHIYVCDRSGFPKKTGRLLAFDMMSDRPEYKYTGSDDTMFSPMDVCTDQSGHVFITDHSNHRIHILDRDGRFLQYMMTKDQELQWPNCIDTDRDGYAWVSEYKYKETNRVKVLKYMD